MKLSTLVKVGELMTFRYRLLLRMRRAKFTSDIENLVSLDYTDQYLRLTWQKSTHYISRCPKRHKQIYFKIVSIITNAQTNIYFRLSSLMMSKR